MLSRSSSIEPAFLPWPPRALSPNGRMHWRGKAAAARKYRGDAWRAALAARWHLGPRPSGPIQLEIAFEPPDARRRDLDNLLASIKAGLDGVADALKVDDHAFRPRVRFGQIHHGGRVVVRIVGLVGDAPMEGKP